MLKNYKIYIISASLAFICLEGSCFANNDLGQNDNPILTPVSAVEEPAPAPRAPAAATTENEESTKKTPSLVDSSKDIFDKFKTNVGGDVVAWAKEIPGSFKEEVLNKTIKDSIDDKNALIAAGKAISPARDFWIDFKNGFANSFVWTLKKGWPIVKTVANAAGSVVNLFGKIGSFFSKK